MMKKTLAILFLFLVWSSYSADACNWKNRIVKFMVDDSCTSYPTLYGNIQLSSSKGISYDWKVLNGGESRWWYNSPTFLYYPGSNSTYTVCLKLKDSINNCDTTLCKTIAFNCLPNCNWKGQNIYLRSDDSCFSQQYLKRTSIAGLLMTNNNYHSTYTYEWKMNGTLVHDTGSQAYYRVDSNGTYQLCVKVTDTVNNCDTTLCKTFNIKCISNCNWKSRIPALNAFDTCKQSTKSYQIFGGVSWNGSYSGKYKYQWFVNGLPTGGNNFALRYPVTSNGSYGVCVKVTDTIAKCDTIFCTKVTVSCMSCKPWKNRIASFYLKDTCDQYPNPKSGRYNGFVGIVKMSTQSSYPYVYQWSVNSVALYPPSPYMSQIGRILSNGTYTICLNIRDTINNCDTTICRTITVKCSSCGYWKDRIIQFYLNDSCTNGFAGVNGLLTFTDPGDYTYCKYKWTVNSNTVAGNYSLKRSLSNGTYTICLNIRDSINQCDTTICRTLTVNCGPCIWKDRITSFEIDDSCSSFYSYMTGNVQLSNNKDIEYEWTVIDTNGGTYNWPGNGPTYYYYPAANGYYTICLKLKNVGRNCDTSICRVVYFDCLPPCQWNKHTMYLNSWDSCKIYWGTRNVIGGTVSTNANYNSRLQYEWTVNDSIAIHQDSNGVANYEIMSNGTYTLCVKVKDTINNCDTMLCRTYQVTCIPDCNWSTNQPYVEAMDSCDQTNNTNEIWSWIGFRNNSTSNYYNYRWSVNGKKTSGNSMLLTYPVTSNGTYVVCVNIRDSVNQCDTTICKTVTVDCISCGAWKNKIGYFYVNDTCDQYPNKVNNRHDGVVGWLNFTNPVSYFYYRYEWTVNSSPVAGNGWRIDESFTSNGTYDICVKIIDTINQCDTTLCKTITVNCRTLGLSQMYQDKLGIDIYPNPAGEHTGFSWKGPDSSYELVNLLGVTCMQGLASEGSNIIRTKDLPNGIYILKIQGNDGVASARIIVQH